jgi:hypothetical protein
MCFLYDGKLTDDLNEKVKDQEFVEMWKVFAVDKNKLIAPLKRKKYKIGYNKDHNYRPLYYIENNVVEYCFHCNESLKDATIILYHMHINKDFLKFKNVKVYVKPEDIIAKGPLYGFSYLCDGKYNSIGVKALTITEEDYNNALKTEKE